ARPPAPLRPVRAGAEPRHEGAPSGAGRGAGSGGGGKKSTEHSDVGGDLVADLDVPPAVASLQVDPDEVFAKRTPRDSLERSRPGRRARSLVATKKGKYTGHRLARRDDTDIAF